MPELLEKANEIVPSSYYDLIARVVPGCVAIAAAGWVFPALAIHPDTATELLLLVGGGYVLGVWLSSVSTLLLLPLQWIPGLDKYSDRAVWAGIRRRAAHVDGSTVIKMAAECTAAENICVVALVLNVAVWQSPRSPVTPFQLRVLVAALPFTILIAAVRRYMLIVRINEPVGVPVPVKTHVETKLTPADLRQILLRDGVLLKASDEATSITKRPITVEQLRESLAAALPADDKS